MGDYEREVASIGVPNLTGKVEISHGEHFATLKAGEIAASHTQFADEELAGFATVQNSSFFGATLMLAACKRMGAISGEVDQEALVKAMLEVMEESGIPFTAGTAGQGGDHAA
jgi:hypothetical protein